MVVPTNRGGGNSEESRGATVDNGSAGVSGYEQFRDQKIRENKERLQKLGILDLALKLKTEVAAPKRPYRPKTHNPLLVSGCPRRSSRLKSVAPVDYVQKKRPVKKDENPKSPKRSVGSTKTKRSVENFMKEGSKPEICSEEHENLLGDCVENWKLGVDDYGEDGRRIYDLVKGEFCHQCRYGKNVIEASENPDWTCPVCWGILQLPSLPSSKGVGTNW